MTKSHATRNFINRNFANVYSVSYCNLAWLLDDAFEPNFYNAGECGWNWDAHIVAPGTVIVTGYRNFTGKHISRKICDKYNEMAREIKSNHVDTWPVINAKLHDLMQDFLKEAEEE